MKLVEIWNSTRAWGALSVMKKTPKLAYRLLKYEKKVERELKVCEKQKDALVYECVGVEPPTPPDMVVVSLPPTVTVDDTENPGETKEVENPQYVEFWKRFNEFLQGDSDLQLVGITMEELIDGLSEKDGNALSEREIELLEPFFASEAAA